MKHLLFLVSFFAVVFKPFAQSSQHQQRFDSAFYHIYQVTASIAIDRALIAADSLYRASTDDVQKIRSLMLISDIYHRMANRDSSIYHAEQAAKIAGKTANYVWQARIFGVLSTQHRETGLLNQGRHYLKKGLAVSQKITRVDVANQFKGHVYQERGFYSMAEDDIGNAIVNFKQAASYFNQLPESANKLFFLAQNDERLGACYFQLQSIDSAAYHFSRALTIIEANAPDSETPVEGFIYNGLGNVKLAQNDPKGAFDYLQQALEVAEATQFPNLKMTVYRSLAQYYEATGDMEAYARYNEMYLGAVKSNVSQNRSYADNIVTNTQTRLDKLAISVKNMLWVIALIVLITTIGVAIYIKKQRQDYERFKQLIQRLRAEKRQVTASLAQPGSDDREIMPEATRLDLLKKLARFESSSEFTDRNISIAVLAGKLQTNTKYLSHIINKHKQKDFNTYINKLRIDYIITKMEDEPKYLHYKISYLADECGFATHSQFTNVFKQLTGISPSTFITCLKKSNQKEEPVMAG